jgi:hypothetical protein
MTFPDWIFLSTDTASPEVDLRAYLAAVARAVGVEPQAATVDLGPPLSAYLAVDHRLVGFPGRDAAVVWDERFGWAVAVETHSREDLIIVGYLGEDVVPAPAAVARFLREVAAGGPVRREPPLVDTDVARELAAYRPAPLASEDGARPAELLISH